MAQSDDKRIAFITGGCGVLGTSICEVFLSSTRTTFSHVIGADLNISENFMEVQKKNNNNRRLHFIKCDVTDRNQFESTLKKVTEEYGPISVLCANAGVGDETKWKQIIDVNLIGAIHSIELAKQFMNRKYNCKREVGTIVLTASVAAYIGLPPCPVYTATKHAHLGLVRSYALQKEFGEDGIKICAICPPRMDTPLLAVGMGNHKNQGNERNLIDPMLVAQGILRLIEDGKQGEIALVKINGSFHHETDLTLQDWMEIQKT